MVDDGNFRMINETDLKEWMSKIANNSDFVEQEIRSMLNKDIGNVAKLKECITKLQECRDLSQGIIDNDRVKCVCAYGFDFD